RVPSLDRNFPGKVARFSEKVQSSSRTMETEVDVANGSLVLVPGMYAEVNLTMERRDKALAIPAAAVGESKVMVVTAGNTLQLRPVELGIETANFVEVRSGLQEGEMVVIGNTGGLQVGQHVKPKLIAMTASKEGR
ncbi:MAG: efflux RND transporter periplasmic adaptor subunit, partial [Bryobacteraceae bacterium]